MSGSYVSWEKRRWDGEDARGDTEQSPEGAYVGRTHPTQLWDHPRASLAAQTVSCLQA